MKRVNGHLQIIAPILDLPIYSLPRQCSPARTEGETVTLNGRCAMISPDAPIVTIFGGSGFVGRYIARRMARAGWRVRIAVRRPNEALFTQTYGVVGQVKPILANIRDDASVAAAVAGASAVVTSVGILSASGKQTFDAVQAEGAGRVARAAADAGVSSLVHISAIGADAESESVYSRTKGEGEANVLSALPNAVILRPSIIFGTEDEFFNRFGGMAAISPVLPVVGADTLFQPVFVDDVAKAAENAITQAMPSGIYELGGPDVASFRTLMERMLEIIHRRRLIVSVPFFLARIMGNVNDGLRWISGGLLPAFLTADQVKTLREDNVASDSLPGLAELGVTPTSMGPVLEEYLVPYRPYGQYAVITESARNLGS